MIARIWQGITLTTNAGQYLEYLSGHILPRYKMAKGNEGAFIMREPRADLLYFLLLAFWASEASMANFVGADLEAVNLTPEEKSLLVAFESNTRDYNVICEC